jgi:hypothetical protein
VNVVTRGGGNQFHGNFGLAFNSDRFDADTRPILRGLSDRVEFFTSGRENAGTFPNPPDDEFTNVFTTINLGARSSRTASGFSEVSRLNSSIQNALRYSQTAREKRTL